MESTAQQVGNSTQPPIIQETTQTFPQTPFSTQFTQNYVPPTSFNQVSPSVPVQASMSFTGQVQAPSIVSLQNTLIPLTLKLDLNNFAIWRSLVLPAIRTLDLEGFLDGSRVCPARFIPNLTGESSSNRVQA